jgi:hypothetical protein
VKKSFLVIFACLAAAAIAPASASTASQREYKRGYADCAAGRWDQDQHGASYKEGCAAAEAKRDAGGAAPAVGASTAPEPKTQPYMDPSVPGKDKQACIRAVKKQTKNPKAVVIGAVGSEANNQVTIGVGPQRAPWKCLVKRGKVAEVMSQTDEGGL